MSGKTHDGAENPQHGPDGKAAPNDESHPSVLIIDDEPGILKTMKLGFGHAGFRVTALDNGEAAKAEVQRREYSVIVTDIFLPGVDGLELLGVIKRKWPKTKVIAISAGGTYAASPFALTMAQKLRADKVIAKPFTADELINVAIELLASDEATGKRTR